MLLLQARGFDQRNEREFIEGLEYRFYRVAWTGLGAGQESSASWSCFGFFSFFLERGQDIIGRGFLRVIGDRDELLPRFHKNGFYPWKRLQGATHGGGAAASRHPLEQEIRDDGRGSWGWTRALARGSYAGEEHKAGESNREASHRILLD